MVFGTTMINHSLRQRNRGSDCPRQFPHSGRLAGKVGDSRQRSTPLAPDQWRKCPQEALIASSFGGTADLHSIGIDSCRFELIT